MHFLSLLLLMWEHYMTLAAPYLKLPFFVVLNAFIVVMVHVH